MVVVVERVRLLIVAAVIPEVVQVGLEVQVLHLLEVQAVMAEGADLGRVVLFM
jgi:hypothetical protein